MIGHALGLPGSRRSGAARRVARSLPSVLTDAEEFVHLRTSEDPDSYRRAAHDTASLDTWFDVIERYPEMRFWVAQNKTIPHEILRVLASDEDWKVRSMVARKRKLEPGILDELAADPNDAVRESVARHRNTPRLTLEKLAAGDPWSEVRRIAQERL